MMGFIAVCVECGGIRRSVWEYDGIYYSMWWDLLQCVGNVVGFITVCVECGGIRRSVWGI